MESRAEEISHFELSEAVFTLAFSPGSSAQETPTPGDRQLEAVELLTNAPPQDRWNRGLLLGLRCPNPEVSDRTIKACIQRLKTLPEARAKDEFLRALLDACFLNLSGYPRYSNKVLKRDEAVVRHFNRLEQVAADLLKAVALYLLENPLALEHHRSRLLSRARQIIHLEGSGDIARAVVDFQLALASEDQRSDNCVAQLLQLQRKFEVYASSKSTDASLLAYLERDSALPVEELSPQLFQGYRFLLNYQTKERAPEALLKALDNLIRWFDTINPFKEETRQDFLSDSMRARAGMPWEELSISVRRHLESHLELLTGPEHPEDLLKLLRNKYTSLEGEPYLIKGLELLQRMPLIRYRSGEICDFLTEPGRLSRSKDVWEALLNLVGAVLTGLADFVLTKETLTREKRRQNLAMRDLLKQDKQFRDLLYQISTDKALTLSDEAEVEKWVRVKAWEVLLNCMPQERENLYREGLLQYNQEFFMATVKAAARQHQRVLWLVVQQNWGKIFYNGQTPEERKARIKALADYFAETRNYDAVQTDANDIGPMIKLALDDQESEIRDYVETSVINAGYQLELQRERQKRELLELREELTQSNNRIIELEKDIARLNREITERQSQRVDHSLRIQELLQERDLIATRGWITTSRLQVNLEEVREALTDALARAQQQSEVLRDLQAQMRDQMAQCQEAYDVTHRLVREQESMEEERDRLEGERRSVERQRQSLTSQLHQAQNALSSLREPRRPYISSDSPEEARRAREQYERQQQTYQRSVRDYESTISRLSAAIDDCGRRISSLAHRIGQANAAVQQLQSEIDQVHRQIRRLDQGLVALRDQYETGQSIWRAIMAEIEHLEAEVQRLENVFASERSRLQESLDQNSTGITNQQNLLEELHRHLESLSTEHNQTSQQLDQQETRSQELAQAIDSGRRNYDIISENAETQSALADTTGFSLQERTETEILQDQEFNAQFPHSLRRGMRGRKPLPTRSERRKNLHVSKV